MSEDKKGRPTPKRKDAERVQPRLAPVVTKEEKKRSREQAKAARVAAREAFMRGDENALPARDRGPARRFTREFVDARRSVGEFFLPIIFFVLILTISSGTTELDANGKVIVPFTQVLSIYVMWGVLALAVLDGLILRHKLKKALAVKFPETSIKGLAMYAWLRSTQMRRMRTPKPSVKAGTTL
jgi:hypothetical protein